MKRTCLSISVLVLFVSCALCSETGKAGADAEAAKHAAEAASVRVIDEKTFPDFVFRQFELGVLSHYSYLLGSKGEAIIVDPARDVDVYIKTAADLGLKITGIYVTHSHADFVAGHMELAGLTGAKIYVNRLTEAGYKHEPIDDGYEIKLGNVRCVARLTPGHTPDGTCMFVYYPAGEKDPLLCLTGDTLFIGSVGRPDLMGGQWSAAQLAEMIYNTWHNVLSKTPDATELYPAHGAGSLCGANLSDANVSTFGEQKQTNPYTKYSDLPSFIMAVLDGLPQAPQYFAKNAAMNKAGPPIVDWKIKMPAKLSVKDVEQKTGNGSWVLDIRDASEFAAGNVPGSINIPIRGRFETWTGIMIPWASSIVLVGSDAQIEEATHRLHRIGYDAAAGYLTGGVDEWKKAGNAVNTVKLVSPAELYDQMQHGIAPILVDVRLPKEWMALRIAPQLLNMPINELYMTASKLDPKMPVLTVCNSAYRSSMGASVLLRAGFVDVRNLAGGAEAWTEAGLPTFSTQGKESGAGAASVFLDIPERMSSQDLAQRLMDLPGTIDVVDIRPSWQFEEYNIAGSVSASPADVLNNPSYLVGKTPLVIVCRDGSISAGIGGALAPKTERSIRYLAGGMLSYWNEVMIPAGVVSEGSAAPAKAVTPSAGAAAPTEPVKDAPPAAAKKRSKAGC